MAIGAISIRAHVVSAAMLALQAGCSSMTPCDHTDLRGKYGLTCALVGMRDEPAPARDVEEGCLQGTVKADSNDAPIVVFLYRERADGVQVIESSMLPRPGQYSFAVPPGTYRVGAFEDDNGDLRYDPTRERAALYHGGQTVAVMPGRRVDRLYLELSQPQRIDFDITLPDTPRRTAHDGEPVCG